METKNEASNKQHLSHSVEDCISYVYDLFLRLVTCRQSYVGICFHCYYLLDPFTNP